MVRPGPRDVKLSLLIAGEELAELQQHSWMMAEAFGLDRRVERYQGRRPIGLYRWDADCLLDVMTLALQDRCEYPDTSSAGYVALTGLRDRLRIAYDQTFGDDTA